MSPIEIGPEQREITLWSWWPGSGRPPPLLLIGGLLLFVGSVFLLAIGLHAYKEPRLSLEGKLTDGSGLAADRPGFELWLITVRGGLLAGGGVILLGYGPLSWEKHPLHQRW
jgi:hypothetical protein